MPRIQRLCIFCGSSNGKRPEYMEAARTAGRLAAERGWEVVYGGGSLGLMGAAADGAIEAGGEVVGVLPRGLAEKERLHPGVPRLHLVDTMHERKATMSDLSDAFLALPGGMGTLEELTEILTWAQLGIHRKPVALLNVAGYFDSLLAFFNHAVGEGFLKARDRGFLISGDDSRKLFEQIAAFEPPEVKPWLDRTRT